MDKASPALVTLLRTDQALHMTIASFATCSVSHDSSSDRNNSETNQLRTSFQVKLRTLGSTGSFQIFLDTFVSPLPVALLPNSSKFDDLAKASRYALLTEKTPYLS
jgi:hypothetical protein